MITTAMATMSEVEQQAAGFAHSGLIDGASIVREYVDHGELGCAVEHLLYMVVETSIELTPASRACLREVAASLGLKHR
jgi:hypothetical protein